jgi:hypothetical protein
MEKRNPFPKYQFARFPDNAGLLSSFAAGDWIIHDEWIIAAESIIRYGQLFEDDCMLRTNFKII